eukprot:scaffold918_cov126-Cylindrotheca_fusiformis.AAC.27
MNRPLHVSSLTPIDSRNYRSSRNSSVLSASVLSFAGDTCATLELNAPLESVQEFLQSSHSDRYLLGTDVYTKREDGLWDCHQPVIEFFGLSLRPVFVHRLDRESPSQVSINIVDARTDIVKNPESRTNKAAASILEASSFVGEGVVSAKPGATSGACELSVDLSLTLHIPLPRFMLIPPGFNSIGSAIVRRAGKSRTKELLKSLQRAYDKEWKTRSEPGSP